MTTHDNIGKKLQFWHEEKKKIVNILELFLYVFLSILFTLIYTVCIHMMVHIHVFCDDSNEMQSI